MNDPYKTGVLHGILFVIFMFVVCCLLPIWITKGGA